MMTKAMIVLMAGCALAACQRTEVGGEAADSATNAAAPAATPAAAPLSLTRLDCGTITIKNFDKFFSDKPGLYAAEARDVTDSCYLIRHGDQVMLWDTGLPAELKGQKMDMGDMIAGQTTTIVEQLAQLGVKPEDVDIVGISHGHSDHTGQASKFPNARLIIGTADFTAGQQPAQPGGPNPLAPWAADGAKVDKVSADKDIFGDGSVTTLHLPGHTPDHMALLVRLASGPVLLSGDQYHATEAREKRGVPPFNTSREQTLASMDKFEAKAKETGAKVIIQHEPNDIAKLPAFPQGCPVKALRSNTPGGPETLTVDEVVDPVAGPGELLVRVRAAAINFPDVLIIEDKYQFKPPRPFAPGGWK